MHRGNHCISRDSLLSPRRVHFKKERVSLFSFTLFRCISHNLIIVLVFPANCVLSPVISRRNDGGRYRCGIKRTPSWGVSLDPPTRQFLPRFFSKLVIGKPLSWPVSAGSLAPSSLVTYAISPPKICNLPRFFSKLVICKPLS